jgi:major vault protein
MIESLFLSLVYRIPPFYYLHVLDQNSNVTRLEVGPKTFVKQDHEKVILGPERMLIIPYVSPWIRSKKYLFVLCRPRHYCVIENPAVRDKDGKVVTDANGQVKLLHSDVDIRFAQEPFPLYPGESLKQAVTPLKVIEPNCALRLRAVLDFVDENDKQIRAGDEFLFQGPGMSTRRRPNDSILDSFVSGTYFPRKEVSVEEQIKAVILKPNEAVRLRAKKEMTDRDGVDRETGEEWLNRTVGSYLPLAYEEVVSTVKAYVLTDKVRVCSCDDSEGLIYRCAFRKPSMFVHCAHLLTPSNTNVSMERNG